MKRILILLLLLVYIAFLFPANESGKLDKMEQELNNPDDDNDDNDEDHDICDEDEDDDDFFSFLFRLLMYELLIGVPADNAARSEFFWGYGFNDYPYSPGDFGAYSIYSTKTVRLDFSTKYFYHNQNLDGRNLRGSFYITPFFSLEGSYLNLQEQLQEKIDELDIYDLYFNYVRFRSEYVSWWWGLGVKHLSGNKEYTGFSLNTGWEIYFMKPLSIDIRLNNAFIKSRVANEINCNLKLHLYNFYIQAGYLREAAGSEAVSGFTAGIGFNF